MSADHNNPALGATRTPDLQGVIRRQWPTIFLCGLVAVALTLAYVSTSDVTYESTSTVLLTPLPGESDPGGGLDRSLDVETQATVARSTALLQKVGDRLGLTASEVKAASRVLAAPTGDVLFIYFIDENAEFAAEGALAYTEEYLAQRKGAADNAAKQQKAALEAQVTALQNEIADLTNLIQVQVGLGDAGVTELQVLQQRQNLAIRGVAEAQDRIANIDDDLEAGQVVVDPRTAVNRTGLRVVFTVAGGLAVGLMVGVIIALLRDRRDDRYGSALGLETLGVQEIARIRYPADSKGGGGRLEATRRAYARLLVRLNFSPTVNASDTRSILVLAVESVTLPPSAVNAVGHALAAEGPDNGLAATLLPSDRGRPDTEANAPHWSTFADSLKQANLENDIVIVTAAPFDRSVAGLAIASKVNQVVLLVSLSTMVSDLLTAIEDLQSVDAHEIGVVVLTRVPPRRRW